MQKEMNIKIDRFLSGEMAAYEQDSFQKEMLNNSKLAAQVQLHREVDEVLSDPQQLDFLNTINRLNEKFRDQVEEKLDAEIIPISRSKNKPVLRSLWPKMLAVASVAAIVFGVYILPMFNSPEPMATELFAAFNVPPDFHENENVMGIKAGEMLSGVGLFNAKKYESAIPKLEAELKKDQDNINVKFMLAYANSQAGNDDVAAKGFDALLKYEDSLLLDEIKWHKALHLLRMKKLTKCLHVINGISAEFMDMENRRELQKKLEKMHQ